MPNNTPQANVPRGKKNVVDWYVEDELMSNKHALRKIHLYLTQRNTKDPPPNIPLKNKDNVVNWYVDAPMLGALSKIFRRLLKLSFLLDGRKVRGV